MIGVALKFIWMFAKSAVKGLLTQLWTFVKFLGKHPKILCAVLGLVVGAVGGWALTKNFAEAKIHKIEKQVLDSQEQARIGAERIRQESKAVQDSLEQKLKQLEVTLQEEANLYTLRLEEARSNKKVKTVVVKVPVEVPQGSEPQEKEIEVMLEDGRQVCRRFPAEFKEQVNEMIKATEDTFK
jgi:hypothetical protein